MHVHGVKPWDLENYTPGETVVMLAEIDELAKQRRAEERKQKRRNR